MTTLTSWRVRCIGVVHPARLACSSVASPLVSVKGKTPHAARHAMDGHIMGKTGNVSAVRRQRGRKSAVYSLQYADITDAGLQG